MNTQICDKCKEVLVLSSFDKTGESYRHTCKKCRYSRTKELREKKALKNTNKVIFKQNKKCITCKETKSINEFNRLSTNKDGISSYCRLCVSKNRKKVCEITDVVNLPNKTCNTCGTLKNISEFKKTKKSSFSAIL